MKLKLAGGLVLALCVATCTAQTSHVTIAHSLYVSCLHGTIQARPQPTTPNEIIEYIQDVDQFCLDWARAWYPAFVQKDQPEMTLAETVRFNDLRYQTVDRIIDEFNEILPKSIRIQKKK